MPRMLLCTALLFFSLASHSAAQPPTIEQLLAGVPVLSTEEKGLDQFSFSYETIYLQHGRLWGDFRWKRGEPPQLYVSADQQKNPVLFAADKRSMYVDLAEQRVVTLDQSRPRLRLRNKYQSISYECSIEPSNQRLSRFDIQIDLPSIVQLQVHNPVLGEDANGNWRYQSTSWSGKSIMIVTFDRQAPYTMREVVISDIETGDIRLRIHDIRLNDECNEPWLRFPPLEALPDGLAIVPMNRSQLNVGMQLALGWNKMIQVLTITHMAVDDPALRGPPLAHTEQEWKVMQQTKQHYGPQLRHLIGIRGVPLPPSAVRSKESLDIK
ncbi:hypothetical protein Pan97_00790 [Bremerella volcania]|uniref:Uncharacterized protein n=1 Tax=Bremerella volcania TaxID=2527984 RepID=A0A518C1K9_9BACT|nr:hypothetical protein [Bremerella volcania]QDU73112.1 hypothetical protein Pan97_00790 [Bremerella volcania]